MRQPLAKLKAPRAPFAPLISVQTRVAVLTFCFPPLLRTRWRGNRTNPLASPFCNKGESVAAGDERGFK